MFIEPASSNLNQAAWRTGPCSKYFRIRSGCGCALRKWGAARLDELQLGAYLRVVSFFVACWHLPGFAPAGDLLSFWGAKKKVGKEKGP
jgi:hypothetical protein